MTRPKRRPHAQPAGAIRCEGLERRMMLALTPVGQEFRVNTLTTHSQYGAATAIDATGDFVVVVNAEKIQVTGNKLDQKMYHRHSGYPGGLRSRTLREQLERRPTEVIRKAVKGMLPRNRLASAQLTKLKIYAGPDHPHAAQAPKPLPLDD